MKEIVKQRLQEFILKFKEAKKKIDLEDASEQTMRSWIDEFLKVFGWDPQNTNQISQEEVLTKDQKEKLKEIDSHHKRPDYTMKNGQVKLKHFDAKDLQDNIKRDKAIAFQIRSYGWSCNMDYSIVTNLEELAVYDCRFKPSNNDNVDASRLYLTIDEYMDNFDTLYAFLYRDAVIEEEYKEILGEVPTQLNTKSLDEDFSEALNEFRLKLAKKILEENSDKHLSEYMLNNFVQSIINRILFVRICEARGLEEDGYLANLNGKNFWEKFNEETLKKFEETYDGPVFYHSEPLNSLKIDSVVFDEFIKSLYYPSPYRFDVMPIQMIASMYEYFLANEITIVDGEIKQQLKSQYLKQQGAVSTPKYLVDFMVKDLMEGLEHISSLDELLEVTILEPACGSGTYLLSILKCLEEKAITLFREDKVEQVYKELFVKLGQEIYCTNKLKRLLLERCIYAIDMDQQAVEVAKVSVALALIENYGDRKLNEQLGLFEKKLLEGIGKNIIHGNTLVEMDIIDIEQDISQKELFSISPCNIKEKFDRVFKKGGFMFIIGNPPYIETKNYIEVFPKMREYLKVKYSFDSKKADMSIYFIDRGIQLLNKEGKMSIICQKRFFKTQYGEKARTYIAEKKCIKKIVDFKTQDIFPKRSTYVAILDITQKANQTFAYSYVIDDEPVIKQKLNKEGYLKFYEINTEILEEDTWNLGDSQALGSIIKRLTQEFGTIKDIPNIEVEGGIQVLNNKVYHIIAEEIDQVNDIIKGKNRKGDLVEIELDICKPIMKNKELYKFQLIITHFYGIFPYTNYKEEIGFNELERKYPKCAEYLVSQKEFLANYNMVSGEDKWHLYTRKLNHDSLDKQKIIYPMTTKEFTATYSYGEPIYLDNANMWGVTFGPHNDEFYETITAIFNSKVFNAFAVYFGNPQRGGNIKVNRQFILPIPLPYNKLVSDKKIQTEISEIVKKIIKIQEQLNELLIDSQKQVLERLLQKRYEELNNKVFEIYELTQDEIQLIQEVISERS